MTESNKYVGRRWLAEDNEKRQGTHKKFLSDEIFLRDMNLALAPAEMALPTPEDEPAPLILFYGLPRCGKTFFSQALRASLDLGIVDNVAARFFSAPCHGIRLSRILGVQNLGTQFQSNYGKTGGLGDPHDFAYFWQYWFQIDDWPHDAVAARDKIDWSALGDNLRRMSAQWGRAGLMKGVLPSYHISQFHQAYRKTLFIFLERDLVDIAFSMLRGRREIYGDETVLYGQVRSPRHAQTYRGLNGYDQIARQIGDLLAMYQEERANVAPGTHITVNYAELCSDPGAVVDRVASVVKMSFDCEIVRTGNVPEGKVRKSVHGADNPDIGPLTRALEAVDLVPRYG